MSKILVTEKITDHVFSLAKEYNCTDICALEGNRELFEKYPSFKQVFFLQTIKDSQWRGWELAEEDVKKMAEKYSALFRVDGYDLLNTVIKSIWWASYKKKGFVVSSCEHALHLGHDVLVYSSYQLPVELQERVKVIPKKENNISILRSKIFINGLFFVFGYDRNNFRKSQLKGGKNLNELKNRRIILPRSIKQVEFYEKVLKEGGEDNFVACFGYRKVGSPVTTIQALQERGVSFVCIDNTISFRRFKVLVKFVMSTVFKAYGEYKYLGKEEAHIICQAILRALYDVYYLEDICSQLQPCVFLTNAFENTPSADLLVQVAHRNSARVVNTMNGAKGDTPQNRATRFDAWAIWSESQKKLLVEEANVPEKQLKITGHLMADKAADYTYSGSYDKILEKWPGKKVMAIFSQPQVMPGDYRERFIKTLNSFIEGNPEFIGIIKPHPGENSAELKRWVSGHKRLILLENDTKQPTVQLYDLLAIADLSIVIYSTVAYESLFFKKPVISLNYTGIEGFLPIVTNGNTWVKEVTESEKFKEALKELLATEKNTGLLEELVGPVDGTVAKRVNELLK